MDKNKDNGSPPRFDPNVLNGTKDFPENKQQGESTLRWKDYLVTQEPEDLPPLLKIGESPVWTTGNHSLIIGKKKSRKTLFLTWLIGEFKKQSGNLNEVLIVDTEQGKKHVWKSRDRIFKLTKQYVHSLTLRGINTEERKDIIEQAIKEGKFKVVLIDGIRDLLGNINDPDQCTDLVIWIEKLTVTYGLHIVNILHQNKTDTNARGHIGSELLNKAEITIELELDEKAKCTLVKCESSRDIPFESFAFTHNDQDLPELVSMPINGKALPDIEQKKRLAFVFEDAALKYNEVIEGIRNHFEAGIVAAKKIKAECERKGWIVKSGKDNSPDTVYKLMI